MVHSFLETDTLEQLVSSLLDLSFVELAKNLHRELNILLDCQSCQKVESLENKTDLLQSELGQVVILGFLIDLCTFQD